MAYSVSWDEATPVGATTPAADIDTELQNLKISVRERVDDLIGAGNWANDAVNPKVLEKIGKWWWGEGNSWTSTTADGDNNTFTFVEKAKNGNFTVGATGVDLDDAGTYLCLGEVVYGTTEQAKGIGGFQGLATIYNPASLFHSTMVIATSGAFVSISGGGIAEQTVPIMCLTTAVAGETLDFLATVKNAGGLSAGVLSISRLIVFVLKLSD